MTPHFAPHPSGCPRNRSGLIYHDFKNKAELLFSYQDNLDSSLAEIVQHKRSREGIHEVDRRFLFREVDPSGSSLPLRVYVLVFVNGELDDPDYQDRNPLYQDFGRRFLGPLFERAINAGEFKAGDPELYGDICWPSLLGNVLENVDARTAAGKAAGLKKALEVFER